MNFNISISCDTCKTQTNCRLGMSNRDVQPLRFRCESCGAPIDITMRPDFVNIGIDIQVSGAQQIHTDDFKPEDNFVDLHLDFPVSFEKYKMGHTPFMRAIGRIGHEAFQVHALRVNYLNDVYTHEKEIKDIFTLYSRNKNELFKNKVLKFLDSEMACDTELDMNRALYHAIERAFFPFTDPKRNVDTVHLFAEKLLLIEKSDKDALHAFISEIVDNGFLKNLQTDCLEIYPRIIDIELILRPALYLDFDHDYDGNKVPYRVSAHEFIEVKDIYKDISEIISRALILVAGINNIIKRTNHNDFNSTKGAPANLDKYADYPLGRKLDFIDDNWYPIEDDVLDNQLRNSVAHYKAEYDEVTQEITYFPKKEGMSQNKPDNMLFLDFSRKILLAFRELHRMNHLTKCLFVFYYLRMQGVKGTSVDI